MSCFYPLLRKIKPGVILPVPCGRCRGCRIDHARDWALRCVHESQLHEENCFITLTYNDENLPKDGSVSSKDVRLFLRRLRYEYQDNEIRFYGCAEYGETCKECGLSRPLCKCKVFIPALGRPHYHILLFGFDFGDKEFHHVEYKKGCSRITAGNSYKVYISKALESIWKKGFCLVGEVNLQSAGYVARYIGKKIGGEMALGHYNGLSPEFSLMSRKPGIASEWIMKYMYDVYPKDFTTVNGRKFQPPRYYDCKLMRHDWDMYLLVKAKREEKTKRETEIRLLQKEKYLKNISKDLRRNYESESKRYNTFRTPSVKFCGF